MDTQLKSLKSYRLICTTEKQQPSTSNICWLPPSSVWIARLNTFNPLRLVKPASSWFTDRKISFMFAAEIKQHCSMDLLSVFHRHYEALCFVWQDRDMQSNRGISSLYYRLKRTAHAPEICAKRSANACSENFCELMNTPQKISSLPVKVITPEN